METVIKKFSPNLVETVDAIREQIAREYGIPMERTTHVHLQCEKIVATRAVPGVIVQCGVWKGASIFAAALFCRQAGITRKIFGFDTFDGFPNVAIHPYDNPKYFATLLADGLIRKDHYQKAAIRTKNFTDISHLTTEHFLDVGEVFSHAKNFANVELVRGLFGKTLPNFREPIAVLYIDCDLYQGYKEVLEILYNQVSDGGAIVFDEYYSLKYPGPRMAVNEFFKDKPGQFETYMTSEGFERWCFMKSK